MLNEHEEIIATELILVDDIKVSFEREWKSTLRHCLHDSNSCFLFGL